MLHRAFPNVYEGWFVVGSAAFTVLIIGAVFFYGFGAFFTEIIDEFHWSYGVTALGFSLRNEVGGIAAPFVGSAIDRFGARKVIIGGIVLSSAGVLALSAIQNLWQFYASILLIAVGTSAAGGAVGFAAIATWFERRRSSAMSLMAVGGGVGGLLVPIVAILIEEYGWRAALRILAAFMLVVGTLAALNLRSRPADHPQPIDGIPETPAVDGMPRRPRSGWGIPWRRAIRSRSFVIAQIGFACLNFGTISVLTLQIPYLEDDLGVTKATAGTAVVFFTIVSIISRFGLGILADRYSKTLILGTSAVTVAIGLPVMALAPNYPVAVIGICIVGWGFGGSIPVRPALVADYFGTGNFGTINGIGQFIGTTMGAAGPFAIGALVDITGAYRAGWLLATAVTLIAIPAFILLRPPHELIEEYRDSNLGPAAPASTPASTPSEPRA